MATAGELIRDALQEIIVQAAEQPLDGPNTITGIRYLNRMMAGWPSDLGYTVVDDPGDEVTVPAYADRAIVLKLAIELAPQFDVAVPITLIENASDAYSNMLLRVNVLPDPSYGSNAPMGSGNLRPGDHSRSYYSDPAEEEDA